MRGGDGILGARNSIRSTEATILRIRTQFLRRRERWLVVLGIILHAVYMLSIFDIYFKTPIVHGMEPVNPRFSAPAKRLVLLVDASFLDEWSLDQFASLLNRSNEDAKLKQLLQQENVVVFLHLLGCDSNGHAHRPYSPVYLNNVKVVDNIAERVYNLVQNYFKDNLTAYVFTADHGMSDKGSHGDGHPSNTDTPLVAWGAGVRQPVPVSENHHHDDTLRFIDDHVHDMPTPSEWGLDGLERQDVNQADIAPLMVEEVEAVLANSKQILNQFLRKSRILMPFGWERVPTGGRRWTAPFKPLADYTLVLDQIEHLLSIKDYEAAKKLSENLRCLALEGLHYFQTYDWFMLMTVISLGYLGWMIYLLVHVLQSYTALPGKFFRKDRSVYLRTNSWKVKSFMKRTIYTWIFLLVGVLATIYLLYSIPWDSGIPFFVWLACWFLSIFTLMPAQIPDNTKLVISSGFMIVVIGAAARYLDMHAGESKYWFSLTHELRKPKFNILFLFQVLLVLSSSVMVSLSTARRTEKQELPVLHQVINWSIAATGILSRLTSIFLGFAPAFLLLSIGYEAVFYGALALALMAWILFENAYLHISRMRDSSSSIEAMEDNLVSASEDRFLQLSDMRIPLAFPFLMAALLIFKLLIPFVLVMSKIQEAGWKLGTALAILES
ncbi:UNVERIFIED_CONTAM: GPI ethanolamine phosphate transferase 1 [Sesamum indicum]